MGVDGIMREIHVLKSQQMAALITERLYSTNYFRQIFKSVSLLAANVQREGYTGGFSSGYFS